ncbi:MAG: hypothetical protein AMS22_15445 [Thiotrichales bacterium SG8_50]|jgi:hypothetical protein|nr:MAG: hypothetical protein AMS22_15445 [Thiotrichales bacterium SG8_50]
MLVAKAVDVVVRKDASEHLSGGLAALRGLMRSLNGTYREDGYLAAVSWMSLADAYYCVDRLRELGLRFDAFDQGTEIAIFEMYGSIPHVNSPWITREKSGWPRGYWITGTDRGEAVDWEKDPPLRAVDLDSLS